ncbi:hypothetical protein B296_00005562 [Ensete ventricosum]|uniref:Uncharacterized protein n=1 Tax=Ensete ventricosum TaxID=4639 RepID=A0A426Z8Y5_ENSVE|nr:hypothetical protein B296_00005562 [Ensete ventricosum]
MMKVLVSKGIYLKNMIKGKTLDTHARSFLDGKIETQPVGSLILKSFFAFIGLQRNPWWR